MNPLLPAFAIVTGFAIACAVWALRDKLWAKFHRDIDWMQATYMRFYPDPVNAQAYMLAYYGVFAFLLAMLILLLPNLILAFAFWFVLLYVPKILIEWAWKRRVRTIDAQISQSVASLSNSMRAGLTLVQAITRLSEQAPDPIKGEFKIMANQYGYGADMETVLKNAKERLKLANFNLFASALLLNREMGGDISETLTRISKSLDKLREMRKTVEAHTSEGRTNIKVLLLAPVVMLLMMATVDAKDVGLLFTTTPGIAILVTAAALAGGGAYIASRITRSEV